VIQLPNIEVQKGGRKVRVFEAPAPKPEKPKAPKKEPEKPVAEESED
jgi:hypothetical protein